jgi:hypothetical protein
MRRPSLGVKKKNSIIKVQPNRHTIDESALLTLVFLSFRVSLSLAHQKCINIALPLFPWVRDFAKLVTHLASAPLVLNSLRERLSGVAPRPKQLKRAVDSWRRNHQARLYKQLVHSTLVQPNTVQFSPKLNIPVIREWQCDLRMEFTRVCRLFLKHSTCKSWLLRALFRKQPWENQDLLCQMVSVHDMLRSLVPSLQACLPDVNIVSISIIPMGAGEVNFIEGHVDQEWVGEVLFCFSVCGDQLPYAVSMQNSDNQEMECLEIAAGDLYILSGANRWQFKHECQACPSPRVVVRIGVSAIGDVVLSSALAGLSQSGQGQWRTQVPVADVTSYYTSFT